MVNIFIRVILLLICIIFNTFSKLLVINYFYEHLELKKKITMNTVAVRTQFRFIFSNGFIIV